MQLIKQIIQEINTKLPRAKPKTTSNNTTLNKICKYTKLTSLFAHQMHKYKRNTYYIFYDSTRYKHYVIDENGTLQLDFNLHPLMKKNELIKLAHQKKQNKDIANTIKTI